MGSSEMAEWIAEFRMRNEEEKRAIEKARNQSE